MTTHKIYLTRFVLFLSLFAIVSVAHAQQTKEPAAPPAQTDEDVLRISTELVQTDVIVTDKQGHFVEGLKPEQFELKIDGKPQPIAFFDSVTSWTASEDKQLAASRTGAPVTTTVTTTTPAKDSSSDSLKRGRIVIFYIDDFHMSMESTVRVRKLLLHFIEAEMSDQDAVAITSATGNLGLLQQFTNNKAVLRSAVDRIAYQPYAVGDSQKPDMSEFAAQAVDRGDESVIERYVEPIMTENPRMTRDLATSMVHQRAEQILRQSALVTVNMLAKLDNFMRNSIRLPGRKLGIFISDGFFLYNRNTESQNWLKRITTTAARAGVVIYTMDARGLVTEAPDPTQEEAFDPFGRTARVTATAQISPAQDALVSIADNTGGRVYVNSNALGRGVTRALEDMSRYYLLTWRPDPETNKGGKFRRLDVSIVGRPELKVRARRGYYTEDAKPDAKPVAKKGNDKAPANPVKVEDEELRAAVYDVLPRRGVPTSLAVNYLDLPDKGAFLTVAMKIPGEALTYEQIADKYNATVNVLGGVFDSKDQPISSFKDELKISANSTDPDNLRNQRVIYTSQVPVKPGLYQVRIATRDAQSKRTGSSIEWIEVPDLTTRRLNLSGLFISEQKAGQAQAASDAEAFKLTNLNVEKNFTSTSKLLFLTYIYNASRGASGTDAPDLAIQIQVLSGSKPVIRTKLMKVSTEDMPDLARLPYSAAIPLTNMPPGRYLLQVTVTDRVAKTSATQSQYFEIK